MTSQRGPHQPLQTDDGAIGVGAAPGRLRRTVPRGHRHRHAQRRGARRSEPICSLSHRSGALGDQRLCVGLRGVHAPRRPRRRPSRAAAGLPAPPCGCSSRFSDIGGVAHSGWMLISGPLRRPGSPPAFMTPAGFSIVTTSVRRGTNAGPGARRSTAPSAQAASRSAWLSAVCSAASAGVWVFFAPVVIGAVLLVSVGL